MENLQKQCQDRLQRLKSNRMLYKTLVQDHIRASIDSNTDATVSTDISQYAREKLHSAVKRPVGGCRCSKTGEDSISIHHHGACFPKDNFGNLKYAPRFPVSGGNSEELSLKPDHCVNSDVSNNIVRPKSTLCSDNGRNSATMKPDAFSSGSHDDTVVMGTEFSTLSSDGKTSSTAASVTAWLRSNGKPPSALRGGNRRLCVVSDDEPVTVAHSKPHSYADTGDRLTVESLQKGQHRQLKSLEDKSVIPKDVDLPQSSAGIKTPVYVRRRRIVDKNVTVENTLSQSELCDLDVAQPGLNFSYSQYMDADEPDGVAVDGTEMERGTESTHDRKHEFVTDDHDKENNAIAYVRTLEDVGNNRHLDAFTTSMTVKSKVRLKDSPQPISRSCQKHVTRAESARDRSSSTCSSFHGCMGDSFMLGYDWIAALVSSDSELMDRSEIYFDELREFRRCNMDECCNDFYMEYGWGPARLDKEPVVVKKALTETRVQPYTVNERLFTVPLTGNLLGEPLTTPDVEKTWLECDMPTRFVRVSVPRCTLQTPYRVRPRRRRSFDCSDSCSLSQTLEEAEKIATADRFRRSGTAPDRNRTHRPVYGQHVGCGGLGWARRSMSTLSLSASLDTSAASGGAASGGQRTDKMLRDTYKMMYEMQRARDEREQERRGTDGVN